MATLTRDGTGRYQIKLVGEARTTGRWLLSSWSFAISEEAWQYHGMVAKRNELDLDLLRVKDSVAALSIPFSAMAAGKVRLFLWGPGEAVMAGMTSNRKLDLLDAWADEGQYIEPAQDSYLLWVCARDILSHRMEEEGLILNNTPSLVPIIGPRKPPKTLIVQEWMEKQSPEAKARAKEEAWLAMRAVAVQFQ